MTSQNLIYILENTTPYQRLLWLKKAFNFWKLMRKSQITIGRKMGRVPFPK